MKRPLVYVLLAIGHLLLVGIYLFLSGDAAGTTMLFGFGVAMGFVIWILVPTFDDIGPTAPVDPNWHERSADSADTTPATTQTASH